MFKPVMLAQVRTVTDPYEHCVLECDGMMHVLHYYLDRASIPHRVLWGEVEDKRHNDGIEPHGWIEIKTAEGTAIVDYRARMWLGDYEHVPHGVFLQAGYPWMHYIGEEIEPVPLPEHIIRFLVERPDIPAGYKPLGLPSVTRGK